jgi:hypothetical protein
MLWSAKSKWNSFYEGQILDELHENKLKGHFFEPVYGPEGKSGPIDVVDRGQEGCLYFPANNIHFYPDTVRWKRDFMNGHSKTIFWGGKIRGNFAAFPNHIFGRVPAGRAIRYKSAVVPPFGLYTAIPHAIPSPFYGFGRSGVTVRFYVQTVNGGSDRVERSGNLAKMGSSMKWIQMGRKVMPPK